MSDLVLQYWWVSLFTVPALAFAFKALAERTALVDAVAPGVRRTLSALDPSYPGHWVVTVTLRDGRRFSRVVIDERFQLVSEAPLPFAARDVADVAREGFAGAPGGPPIQLSEGRP